MDRLDRKGGKLGEKDKPSFRQRMNDRYNKLKGRLHFRGRDRDRR
jgi:hypothetical protein